MCCAPQRRALFRHLNFQKWSVRGVLCTFLLRNVLRATTACNFSFLIRCFREPTFQPSIRSHKSLEKRSVSRLSYLFEPPKVVRTWCVLYIFTLTCASRHDSVQFFISHLASWLRTCRCREPTFRPSGATKHRKTQYFATFLYIVAPLHLLSSDSFSSLICSLLLFSCLCLFPSLRFICPYCWKFDF